MTTPQEQLDAVTEALQQNREAMENADAAAQALAETLQTAANLTPASNPS